ncbi:MAG: hypothetical protein JWQ43_4022 [Glaciihabitans sp.]|nr:hypothetical protein [Glaciihabitans sp.]
MRLKDMGDEALLLAAGGRAILLQLANPAVGHAVAEHSSFAADPTRRLRHTLTFVYAVVWGTPNQAAFVTQMVNRAHAPVKSPSYDATDPALQLWVNATLYDSAARIYSRVYGQLSDADADAIYQDYGAIGAALQMPRELWPVDRAAFAEYWNRAVANLQVDDEIRAVAQTLLHPKTGALWLRAAMPLAGFLTAGLLSADLRAAFALPWDAGRQKRFDRLMRVTAMLYPRLPKRLRYWPKKYLLGTIPDRAPAPQPAA